MYNVSDLRPWFKLADRVLDVEYSEVQGHPAMCIVVQVLDRKRYGRAPANASPHDRPATSLCVLMVLLSGFHFTALLMKMTSC